MADEIRSKIQESLNTCLTNLFACQTMLELAVPVEIMIRQVTSFIKPNCDVEFIPLKKDPQEILNQEEKKEEVVPQVYYWMDKLQTAIKNKTKENLEQIQVMLVNRASIKQSVNQMEKFNIHSTQLLNQSISEITKEIEMLQNEENRLESLKVSVDIKLADEIKNVIEQISQVKVQALAKKLVTSYNDPYMPIVEVQDYECPQNDKQAFENYLVAIENNNGLYFNFRFKQGDKSDLKAFEQLQKFKIKPKRTEVQQVVFWYGNHERQLICLELFDKDSCKILEAGVPLYQRQNCNTHQILLEEGQRIIGFKSRKGKGDIAIHYDFQFLLAKLV